MMPPSPSDPPHPEPGPGDAETEPRPAATTAGGPIAAQGSASNGNGSNGSANVSGNGHSGPKQAAKRNGTVASAALKDRVAVALLAEAAASPLSRSEQFAAFQADAPACDNCGAITVRSGNCYLCYNCGSSMGCS